MSSEDTVKEMVISIEIYAKIAKLNTYQKMNQIGASSHAVTLIFFIYLLHEAALKKIAQMKIMKHGNGFGFIKFHQSH